MADIDRDGEFGRFARPGPEVGTILLAIQPRQQMIATRRFFRAVTKLTSSKLRMPAATRSVCYFKRKNQCDLHDELSNNASHIMRT
jgi:hypothetical protein